MNNKSTSGGIILPHPKAPKLETAPPNLTLVQFIQTILVGLSGIPGPFVRPEWQPEEPKQPDIGVDWIAFGIKSNLPDANAYQSIDNEGATTLQRQETLTISLSVYGPQAMDTISLIRDGFQIPQNSSSLKKANMGYVDVTESHHVPDLVNERWIDRYVCDIILHRYIVRNYPILDFISATGTVYSETAATLNYSKTWQVGG